MCICVCSWLVWETRSLSLFPLFQNIGFSEATYYSWTRERHAQSKCLVWILEELSRFTIRLHKVYSYRNCISSRGGEICYWPPSPKIGFSSRMGPRPIIVDWCVTSWMTHSRYMDRKRRTLCLATQVTLFDSWDYVFGGLVNNYVYPWGRLNMLEELRHCITYEQRSLLHKCDSTINGRLNIVYIVARTTLGRHIDLKLERLYSKLCKMLC